MAPLRIGSIVFLCQEFDQMVSFWQAALDYVAREPASDGWVVLCDPAKKGPNLSFNARKGIPKTRGWLHLDLYAKDQGKEISRLIGLGARVYPWVYEPDAD
ncbi:VOC family protein [Comamonas odontotermitis]|uniref:VOC family protein n=1 Tax=Comamonas odontotermitis TaxID=379895 RepID=UPI0037529919